MNIMESLEYRYTLGFNRMNDESSIKGEFKKVLNDVCNRTDTKIEDVSPFQLEIIILLSAILMCFTYKNLEEGIELTISSMVYTHLETIYNVLNKNEE